MWIVDYLKIGCNIYLGICFTGGVHHLVDSSAAGATLIVGSSIMYNPLLLEYLPSPDVSSSKRKPFDN